MKLMIVEDDSFMLQIYHNLFQLEGIEIETAKDGLDALEKLRSDGVMPAAIVLDIMMPRMDGYQFLEEQQKDPKLKDIPVIVLSNLFSPEDQDKAKKLGAKELLVKSAQDPKELIKKIKDILPTLS